MLLQAQCRATLTMTHPANRHSSPAYQNNPITRSMARHCPTSAIRRLPRVRQVVVTSWSPVTVMPSVFLHSSWLDSSLDTSSLSHPATRHHISLAYPIASVIARICHTLARERFSRRVVVTCYEYYANCLAFCIRQCHTLRLAIARLPIRLLDPWLDTVQPRP